ncbi:hypothetical protein HC928_20410 [bacterium]|nr:hypothetical protein [bacterium]
MSSSCVLDISGAQADIGLDHATVFDFIRRRSHPLLWPEETPLCPAYTTGMSTLLQYGDEKHGLLVVVRQAPLYDENHLQLFSGIGKQATLALQNARLYQILQDHANDLEDRVAARTRELESAQQMLIRSEKLASVGRLAASIAHEINNPLLPIRINLEHMREDLELDGQIDKEDIERTQESVERISRIVSRLLEFTGKRQKDNTTLQPLDINTMLESVISLNRKFFQQENIALDTHFEELPLIQGNKDQLEQVFMNLMLNAKAAMEAGGRLEIKTHMTGGEVFISMVDTGHGIPEDMIESIFEPFVSTKEEGTGLGLFISFGIVQNHNGVIEVASRVGEGTTFTIRLPVPDVEVIDQNESIS